MNIPCGVINDLLPLYHDGICDESSKNLVENHLAECTKCRASLGDMKDNRVEEHIMSERKNVLDNHISKIKKSLVQGLSIAIIMTLVPTFVVNLVTSKTLDWFYFVLSGALLFGSITIVPLVFEKHRGTLTLISSVASLLLLLFKIDSFIGGYSWFKIAAIPILITAIASWAIVSFIAKKK